MVDPMAPIRAEVMAQPAAERLEYALDLLAFHLDPIPPFYDWVAQMGLAFANADTRMLHALDVRRGRYVTLNALVSARCLDRPLDEWTTQEKVVLKIGAVRRRLEKLALPVAITTSARCCHSARTTSSGNATGKCCAANPLRWALSSLAARACGSLSTPGVHSLAKNWRVIG